jgi:hypothetical protein
MEDKAISREDQAALYAREAYLKEQEARIRELMATGLTRKQAVNRYMIEEEEGPLC